jgi:selenocysteine-specific elongation factor
MHVVATAGHVDHGKSTLVRALTGMEPDRWAEERRRGMTIDLGFAWTTLPGGEQLAFVDVPGHERFVPNMLAGIGPVPATLLVVAADEGWMPQTAEHVAALDALGVRHAVLAITRADLADPELAIEEARDRLAGTSLAGLPAVAVSAPTGAGLDALRTALADLVAALPAPDPEAPVRLWVDRAFTIRGSGTVVTGTLSGGTLTARDELVLHSGAHGTRPVRVRALQSLGQAADRLTAVARVAVNLRGVDVDAVSRGDALLTPSRWTTTSTVDVRVDGDLADAASSLVLHLGSAAIPVHVRPLGGPYARLTLHHPAPVAAGDVALLRDPGLHRIVGRVTVADTDPPPLRRRGAAAARAADLTEPPDGAALLRRRGIVRIAELRGLGTDAPAGALVAGDWVVDPEHATGLRARLAEVMAEHRRAGRLEAGPTVDAVRTALGLPHPAVLVALLAPPLAVRNGQVVDVTAPPTLPPAVAAAVAELARDLATAPFAAPDAGRLADLGLGTRELAAAERAGALLRVTDGVVLLPGAEVRAVQTLAALAQPFTLSEARQALGTTRRVAVPLLELLDRRRLTRRLPDDRRSVVASSGE